jgi:hypothetical protein
MISAFGYQLPNWSRQMDGRFEIEKPTLAPSIANV